MLSMRGWQYKYGMWDLMQIDDQYLRSGERRGELSSKLRQDGNGFELTALISRGGLFDLLLGFLSLKSMT